MDLENKNSWNFLRKVCSIILLLLVAKFTFGQSYQFYDFSSFNGPGEWVSNGSNIGSLNGNMSFNLNGSLANSSSLTFTSPNFNYSSNTQYIDLEYELDINLRNAYWGDLFTCWCLRYDALKLEYLDIGGWKTAKTHNGNVSGYFMASIPNSAIRLRFVLETDAGNTAGKYAEVMEMSLDQGLGLPVELLDFQISLQSPYVVLNWSTSSEINNSHFVIERAGDGHSFRSVGKLEGMGNSSLGRTYYFVDSSAFEGNNYYRLKQVDFNGEVTYFGPKFIYFEFGPEEDIRIFPNPTSEILFIQLSDQANTELLIKDQMGKVLIEKQLTAGENRLDLSELKSGYYFVSLQLHSKILHRKILLL